MSSRIQLDHRKVTQAGVELGGASNTISEVLGKVAAVSQAPTAAPSFGEAHLSSVFESFWTALRQQVQLSSDVFGELGKRMGQGAVQHLKNGDTKGANKIKHAGGGTSAPTTTTPSTPAPGAGGDTTPPPVSSAPPPPDQTSAPPPDGSDGSGDGTVNAPGSATPTDQAIVAAQAQADQATAAAQAATVAQIEAASLITPDQTTAQMLAALSAQ